MPWFAKKKTNPEDGDFPRIPKHYCGGRALTQTVNIVPPVQWNAATTVVWGIDIGAGNTTVSFAYLEEGHDIAIHNITYWPKEFPLRESSAANLPLPDLKSSKTFKTRGAYTSTGFVSHPTWTSEKTASYLYMVNSATSSPAFQVRTGVSFLESPERHKYSDLVEHLLKHALNVYGAVIKPTQPHWPRASHVIITLPSGLPRSAEMTITGTLDRSIPDMMPKVIGSTQICYVRRPDVRLFEDDLWRNIDSNFHDDDNFMLVEWDMTSGDMLCTSYKAIQHHSGQMMFGTRLCTYLSALPAVEKRNATVDEREGVRFASALQWCAINKHRVQKLIIRTSNPIKKPDNLLTIFHKTLVDGGFQAGLRPIDPLVETGALGAVVWYTAHEMAKDPSPDGDSPRLIQDMTRTLANEVEADLAQPSFSQDLEPPSRLSRAFNSLSMGMIGRGEKQDVKSLSVIDATPELPASPFTSTPLAKTPSESMTSPTSTRAPLTPAVGTASLSAKVDVHTLDSSPGPLNANLLGVNGDEEAASPPAYIDGPSGSRNAVQKLRPGSSANPPTANSHDETNQARGSHALLDEQHSYGEPRLVMTAR